MKLLALILIFLASNLILTLIFFKVVNGWFEEGENHKK